MDQYQDYNLRYLSIPGAWVTYCHPFYHISEAYSAPALHGTTINSTVNGSVPSFPQPMNMCGTLSPRPSVIRHRQQNQRPMNTSENQVRPQCSICNKTFSKPGTLKVHMRIHTGEKPFQCQYCPKTFNQSGSLIAHVRTHTGEKPFKCQFCGKGFTQSSSQKSHVMTHYRKMFSMAEAIEEALSPSKFSGRVRFRF